MNKKDFFNKYFGVAKTTSSLLGGQLDPYIILSFWHWETGGGTNRGATDLNNLGGIKFVDQKRKYGINATQSGMYANYNSLNEFAKDYARILKLGYYKDVLTSGMTKGYEDDVVSINKSPYAEADYSVSTVVGNAIEFSGLGGESIVIDDDTYTTIENKNNLSVEEIGKAIAIGIAFMSVMALIKD